MSLETWKEKFYPVEANEVPQKDAIAHSLKKWQGLTQENLDKHDLSMDYRRLHGDWAEESLWIDSSSCALCQAFREPGSTSSCAICPLAELKPHIDPTRSEPCDYEYHRGVNHDDPLPMIALLTEALEAQNAKASQVQSDQATQGFGEEVQAVEQASKLGFLKQSEQNNQATEPEEPTTSQLHPD